MNAANGIITLLKLPGVGRKTIFRILESGPAHDYSYAELRDILFDLKLKKFRVRIPEQDEFNKARTEAEAIEAEAEKMGIKIALWGTAEYPHRLSTIMDSPAALFIKGNPAPLHSDASVAIVGTRKPTPYGLNSAEKIGMLCAERGFVVISGLASGCDTAAHQGCIAASGKTVAVLAHGLDMIYPKENESLAEDIIGCGGCLLSEYLPGQKPLRNYFIERDRLQSGLSAGVIVIETGIKGGTMHTVKYSMEQGKKLGCISHPIDYDHSIEIQGNKHLIETNAAKALKDKSDMEIFLSDLLSEGKHKSTNVSPLPLETNQANMTQPSLFDTQE